MSALGLLSTDLQSISTESRRKHTDVRDASEHSLSLLRASPEEAAKSLAQGDAKAEELLKPIFLGCQTKNAKIVGIAIGTLQRLIAAKIISSSFAPRIVSTLTECVSQGVDIQLRILQTLLSLLTNVPDIHGDLLLDALLVCFRLHDSKTGVVSSTAAATLRQLVMLIFEKVGDEDRSEPKVDEESSDTTEVQLPDGATVRLRTSANDAYVVLYDLCLLVNSSRPQHLKLSSLSKTFDLELIESVLTNHPDLFRKHSELQVLLRHQLCPFLLKALSDKPVFPLTLRSVRVVFLFLRQFMRDFTSESEVFLSLLTKSITGELDAGQVERPHWFRVLSAEVIRGLCGHADLLTTIWELYDSQPSGSKVFGNLISAMNRLATERPTMLGVNNQVHGLGLPGISEGQHGSSGALDMGSMAGMVASAASATVSGVVGMIGNESGLSLSGSAMKISCIDQLDKTDAPPIPESYIYLLALQTLVAIAEGLSSQTLPLYTSIAAGEPRTGPGGSLYAPRALHLDTIPDDAVEAIRLRVIYAMTEAGWPALLASLSFFMSTNLSDELFVDVLASFRNLINVSGVLGLSTPRDAFLTGLAKFAVPPRVVSAFDAYVDPPYPRSPAVLSVENLGLTGLTGTGPSASPTLSERNIACLKVYLTTALYLAGSLAASWYDVFETLQNAEHVLGFKVTKPSNTKGSPSSVQAETFSPKPKQSSGSQGGAAATANDAQPRHPILSELDRDHVKVAIRRLFEVSKSLDSQAFNDFVVSLCKLSADMVSMQSGGDALLESESMEDVSGLATAPLSPRSDKMRRRASGMQMPRTVRTGDFGISKLGLVANLNVQRLISADAKDTLQELVNHLISVLHGATAPSLFRLQATETLDDVLLAMSRTLSPSTDRVGDIQRLILEALASQMATHTVHGNASTLEIRRLGLDTLHSILQQAGHTLVLGWDTIFAMLSSVCKVDRTPSHRMPDSSVASSNRHRPPPLQSLSTKGDSALVRVAFSSLKLICNDYLPSLSVDHLRLCMSTLVNFGKQTDDLNISLTAGSGLLSNISDFIQTQRVGEGGEYDALWMFLLHQLLALCDDARPEARNGSIQTLCRTLQLYGTTLTQAMWDECLWQIIIPLLRSLQEVPNGEVDTPTVLNLASPTSAHRLDLTMPDDAWDETKILAWQSLGSILSEYLNILLTSLPSFPRAWQALLAQVKRAFVSEELAVSAAAMRSLERVLRSSDVVELKAERDSTGFCDMAWEAWTEMGSSVVSPPGQAREYTQDALLALVETGNVICRLSLDQWNLDRCRELLRISKGVVEYSNSPEYRPDIDSLSPCQSAVLKIIDGLDTQLPGTTGLLLAELADYTRLAFLPFAEENGSAGSPTLAVRPVKNPAAKRVTYIALAKKAMPLISDRFIEGWKDPDLFIHGTVEAILSAYALPMRLKYGCPPASKLGSDPPLWKTATTCFIQVLGKVVNGLSASAEIPSDRIEGIWSSILNVFEGSLKADCSPAGSFTLQQQEAEEEFDKTLIVAIESDVLPHLGDTRVSIDVVKRLPELLASCSQLHESALEDPLSALEDPVDSNGASVKPSAPPMPNGKEHPVREPNWEEISFGSTLSVSELPRERFRYWSFDMLFLACSCSRSDHEPERRRLAALSLSTLLSRCRVVLASFVADDRLRGNIPFARIREDELLYVLRKLLDLRLWTGSLWAAFSDDPWGNAVRQPAIDPAALPANLIRDHMQKSSRAHLSFFYTLLCDIVSIPRPPPSAWIPETVAYTADFLTPRTSFETWGDISLNSTAGQTSEGGLEDLVQIDSRQLARFCLAEIGKEMGF